LHPSDIDSFSPSLSTIAGNLLTLSISSVALIPFRSQSGIFCVIVDALVKLEIYSDYAQVFICSPKLPIYSAVKVQTMINLDRLLME
jgi:hypothetical protein